MSDQLTTVATVTPSDEALALKTSALRKLHQAEALIDSARKDMSILEGIGYAKNWEQCRKLSDQLGAFTTRFFKLKSPTGVLKF